MSQPMKTFTLTTRLLAGRSRRGARVVRELEVHEDSSLYDLAEAIVHAHGFEFDHAFGFFSRTGDDYLRSERKYELFADMPDIAADHPQSQSVQHTKVSAIWKLLGDSMTFLFDYGDTWQFAVKLIGIGVADPKATYPRILKKTGKAPEQYPPVDEE